MYLGFKIKNDKGCYFCNHFKFSTW